RAALRETGHGLSARLVDVSRTVVVTRHRSRHGDRAHDAVGRAVDLRLRISAGVRVLERVRDRQPAASLSPARDKTSAAREGARSVTEEVSQAKAEERAAQAAHEADSKARSVPEHPTAARTTRTSSVEERLERTIGRGRGEAAVEVRETGGHG